MQFKINSFLISFCVLLFLISCKSKKEDPSIGYLPNNTQQYVVNDLSNLFSLSERDSLEKRLIDYEKSTTNQIAIVTFDSIPKNTNAMRYATDIAHKWGVGRHDTNNGLLILISRFDREMAIATGYGTEKVLTDSICSRIINETIIPHFKNENYFEGVNNGLDSIIHKWR